MRWFPDGETAWRGEAVFYSGTRRTRSATLSLAPSDGDWRICTVAWDGPITASCAPAFFGPAPEKLSGKWSEIFASSDRLKLIARDGATSKTIIDAVRDGCD